MDVVDELEGEDEDDDFEVDDEESEMSESDLVDMPGAEFSEDEENVPDMPDKYLSGWQRARRCRRLEL